MSFLKSKTLIDFGALFSELCLSLLERDLEFFSDWWDL